MPQGDALSLWFRRSMISTRRRAIGSLLFLACALVIARLRLKLREYKKNVQNTYGCNDYVFADFQFLQRIGPKPDFSACFPGFKQMRQSEITGPAQRRWACDAELPELSRLLCDGYER
jgi:hypothetical protein